MNSIQRLLSNTVLSFLARFSAKFSDVHVFHHQAV